MGTACNGGTRCQEEGWSGRGRGRGRGRDVVGTCGRTDVDTGRGGSCCGAEFAVDADVDEGIVRFPSAYTRAGREMLDCILIQL